MESTVFQICQTTLAFSSEKPLRPEGNMLPFLADASAPGLKVVCRVLDEPPSPEGTLLSQKGEKAVYRKGREVFRSLSGQCGGPVSTCIAYEMGSPGAAELTVAEKDWSWSTDHLRLWSTICLPQLLLPFRTLIFHASYIEHKGSGILFTAPSGTGKSTQAELWRVHRSARVLNGDKAGVTLREMPMAHGLPFAGTSKICENVSLPLRGIVVLSQAPVNSIRRLRPSEAVAALCSNLFVDQVIPEEWSLALNLLLDLVAAVPVYALACTPDERAVQTLEQALN